MNELRNAISSVDEFIHTPFGAAIFIGYVLVFIVGGYVVFVTGWRPSSKRRKRT